MSKKSQPNADNPKGIHERDRKIGPSAPVAGLLSLAADALPTADQAAKLVSALRAGEFDAHAVTIPWGTRKRWRPDGGRRAELTYYPAVVNAFLPLLAHAIRNPRYGQADPRGWHDDRLGYLYERLILAVDRLRLNSMPDAVKEITRELYRGRLGYWRQVSMDVRAPSSTNSDRKRRGKSPHPSLKRRATIERRGKYIDPLKDDETLAEAGMVTQPAEIHETEAIVPETPLEKTIIGMVMAGLSERDIAASLRITRHQVRRILNILRLRSQRAA